MQENKIFLFALCCAIFTSLTLNVSAASTNEIIIKYKKNRANKPIVNKSFRTLKTNLKKSEYAVIEFDNLTNEEIQRKVNQINHNKKTDDGFEVEAAYLNTLYEINDIASETVSFEQWALDEINANAAWQESLGEDIVVAVLDTGVDYNHPDLKANIWTNEAEIPNNGKDDDFNGYIDDSRGWDFVKTTTSSCLSKEDCSKRDNDPSDIEGHGTHVAGIIAAANSNGFGINGIAPKAKIMPIRVAFAVGGKGLLKASDVLEGIAYAINNDADILNMSFAGAYNEALADMLKLAYDSGVVLVASAGNSGTTKPVYPAALDEVISVGSIDQNGQGAFFSNFGDWVDIVSPGVDILSAAPFGQYTLKSGTSMSAPYVAGVAALVMSKNEAQDLSPEQVKARILASSESSTFFNDVAIPALQADTINPFEVISMDLPEESLYGENILMSGDGLDEDFAIVNYEWVSTVDGFLSDAMSFSVNDLSIGQHLISFRVQNSAGLWSSPVYRELNILDQDRDVSLSSNESFLANKIKFKLVERDNLLKVRLKKKSRKYVESFRWESNVNGDLGTNNFINLSSLSPGLHQISFWIQDKNGNWSSEIKRIIEI